jgi:hypothetical protein
MKLGNITGQYYTLPVRNKAYESSIYAYKPSTSSTLSTGQEKNKMQLRHELTLLRILAGLAPGQNHNYAF